MKKAKMPLFSAALLAVFVLGACGGDETSTDGNGEQNNNGGEESSSGGTLIFARGGDSQSLDYASVTDGESSRVTKQIYETLIEFADDSFELEPGLAKDWDVDDEGLRYVFYLQEGVTFHDGTPFNADAVKTNFERWADPDHEYAFTDEGYS
ncbi:ABC transporter substrate-binding protein, partial [Bacillus subtilis]